MTRNKTLLAALTLAGVAAGSSHRSALAQDIQFKLVRAHSAALTKALQGPRHLAPERALSESRWQAMAPKRLAQVGTGPLGVPQGLPQTPTGPAVDPETQPQNPTGTPVPPASPRREISAYVDTRLGFDKQKTVVYTPGALELDVRRRIKTVTLSFGYPLTPSTSIYVGVPYVNQSTEVTAPAARQSIRQRGSGIGDVSAVVERRFPEIGKGTELSLSVGMQIPTGKDPFNLAVNELPTGIGFYQGLVSATIRKMHVPLYFYGSVDYAKGFSRNVAGQRLKLPDSYGAEVGFYYTLGPEFTTGTAISWNRLSSPFLIGNGQQVAYLSQSLNYNTGKRASIRGSVDVGLTEESTDVYLGLALNTTF